MTGPRLWVDASALEDGHGGVARYLEGLLPELARGRPDWRIVLLFRAHVPEAWANWDVRVVGPRFLRARRSTWEHIVLSVVTWRHRRDIFLFPQYDLPLMGPASRCVAVIHDVSFMAFPEWDSMRLRFLTQGTARHAARRARLVVTDSRFSASEIKRWLGSGRSEPEVVPLAAGAAFSPQGAAEGGEPYILFVGDVVTRRRVPELIVAAESLGLRVIIVGSNHTRPRVELPGSVEVVQEIDDARLAELYRGAVALAYPSIYEGFGLPPLEAMACGCPVVAFRCASVPEVVGDAAVLVDADDWAAFRDGLETVRDHRELWAAAGLERARQFSWQRTARKTAAAIESAFHLDSAVG